MLLLNEAQWIPTDKNLKKYWLLPESPQPFRAFIWLLYLSGRLSGFPLLVLGALLRTVACGLTAAIRGAALARQGTAAAPITAAPARSPFS
jgi:hypothetical protein